MDVTIRVRRFDPEAENPESYWQEYPVTIEDNGTVLDALIKIREEIDGTLTLRCSCRSAICGSCAMRINGHAALACKTQAVNALNQELNPAQLQVRFATAFEHLQERETATDDEGIAAHHAVRCRGQRR